MIVLKILSEQNEGEDMLLLFRQLVRERGAQPRGAPWPGFTGARTQQYMEEQVQDSTGWVWQPIIVIRRDPTPPAHNLPNIHAARFMQQEGRGTV